MNSVACPACSVMDAIGIMDYPEFPTFLFPMAQDVVGVVDSVDLDLHLCSGCGHLFQADVDHSLISRIYEEYYANYPYDSNDTMAKVYREPFHHFFDLMSSTLAAAPFPRLIEIGCSSPANMLPFVKKGWKCIGIDPSPLADDASVQDNISIVSAFYEESMNDTQVEVIVSRFNLEHIADLTKHLSKMKYDLRDGGRVIVQVPNVAYYLENFQPLFVAHEHIHYFSEHSLVSLFERMGFSTVACYSAGEPSILACFEKPAVSRSLGASVAGLVEGYKVNVLAKSKELIQHVENKHSVTFYGCGLSLFWALAVLHEHLPSDVLIVDDNPSFEGKLLPRYGHPIGMPQLDQLSDSDLVVLTLNPMYHDRVIDYLRSCLRPMKVLRIGVRGLQLEHLS